MALTNKGQVKRIVASGGGTLTPRSGHSLIVRDIFCKPSANDTFLTVKVNQTTLQWFRVAGYSGNEIPYPAQATTTATAAEHRSLFDVLRKAGHPIDIPVADGSTLTVSRYAEAGDVTIVYDEYDAGDVKDTDPNGAESKKRVQLVHGTNAGAIAAAGDAKIDALQVAGCVHDFPINGDRVPSGAKGRILGVLGCPCAKGE
jgi:hypothetical protein